MSDATTEFEKLAEAQRGPVDFQEHAAREALREAEEAIKQDQIRQQTLTGPLQTPKQK